MGELKSNRYDSTIAEKANTPFAKRFRDLVSDAKTANDLKDYLGITIQAINQYKQGTAYPKTENLIKIADYFSISVDYLLGLSNTPSRKEDIQAACKTTGLSEKAINRILLETAPLPGEFVPESEMRLETTLDTLLTSASFWRIVRLLGGYINAPKHKLSKAAEIYQEYRLINDYGVEESVTVKDVLAFKAQRVFAALLDELDSNSEKGGK